MSERVVLVTGGGGFIGRHVHEPLRRRGFRVVAPSSSEVDLLGEDTAQQLVERVRPTHLLHFAWYAEPGRYWTSELNRDWLAASERLVAAFRSAGGVRAVTAGTCAEYDWTVASRCVVGQTPERPGTLYGECKLALSEIGDAHGRIFFPFGPGEHPARLVASVARNLVAGEPAPTSHGRQLRDFMYVADVADAFAALLDSDLRGPVNIGSGQGLAIADVVRMLGDAAGRPDLLRIGALEARPGEPEELVADVGPLHDATGWRPGRELGEGLAETLAWWRMHADDAR